MQKYLTIILIILLYSCGGDEPTSPQIIDYYSEDGQFLEELSISNGKSVDYFSDFIENVLFDSSGYKSYRIKKMYLDDKGLDSLPTSIGQLDSLTVLKINDNNLHYITESICNVYGQLDSLDIDNNKICTPTIPECIEANTTLTSFYDNQQCEISPDPDDMAFISDIISVNWGDTASIELTNEINNSTTWEIFAEDNFITYRITKIQYDDIGIKEIPQSIGVLDKLEHLELQKNQIKIIPSYIGNLSRLKYFHIFDNQITTIPAKIGFLSNLEVFKIYENNLEEIDSNIGELTKLITFWVSENQLISLPDSMCKILTNPGIDINIDNNKICNNNYDDCFKNLVDYSEGQDCTP